MGRHPYSTRNIVESTSRLEIRDLANSGLMKPGCRIGTITWSVDGKLSGMLNVHVNIDLPGDPNSLGNYILFDYILDEKSVQYVYLLDHVHCYYGGYRYYFLCKCGKRILALFLDDNGYYSCRFCQGLVYQRCREHRGPHYHMNVHHALNRRAELLKKQGRHRKARILRLKADNALLLSFEKFQKDMNKILARIKRKNRDI